jgi:hypothetical protein
MGDRLRSAAAAILASGLLAPFGCVGHNLGGGTAGSTGAGGSGATSGTVGGVAGTGGGVGGTGGDVGGISGTGGAARGGAGGGGGAGGAAGAAGGGAAGTGGSFAACTGHDIDVPVATVAGTVTVNGAPFSSTTEPRRLSFRNASGDTAETVATGAGSYTARLVPGTYDVYYLHNNTFPTGAGGTRGWEGGTPGSALPLNSLARVRAGVVIPTGSSSLNIDIPVATVTGSFTVDGAPVPSSPSDFARIYLRNVTSSDSADIGDVDFAYLGDVGMGTYTARLVPGTYNVEYALENHSSTLPLNSRARFRTGVVIPTGSSSLNIDVPVATVTGSITVGGAAVSSSTTEGHIFVRNATTGGVVAFGLDFATLGYTGQGTYAARLVPGTYDVYYSAGNGSPNLPSNGHARILAGIVIPAGSSSLDIDVPVATVTGSFTVDGVPSASNDGFISLENAITGDGVSLGNTGQSTYSARLIPGTYDVYLSLGTPSPTLPINGGRIRTGVVIPTGSSSLDIDVPVATVTGAFTVNGVAAPSTSIDGRIALRNVNNDYFNDVGIGYTGQTTYTALLIPGTYDIHYSLWYSLDPTSTTLPINNGYIRTGVVIATGSSSLDVDIPVATVTGSLTVNRAAVPSTSEYGYITIKNATTGHSAFLGYTTQTAYTANLIPGSYDVYYTRVTGSSIVPLNLNAKLRCFSVP